VNSPEFKTKLDRVRGLLREKSLKGLLLSSRPNFSWLSCGRSNHVRWNLDKGVASLWVTEKGVELWTNAIEKNRFQEEETKGLPLLYRAHPWWRDEKRDWLPKGRVGSDDGAYGTLNLREEVAALRWSLTAEEAARFRRMGKLSGEAMSEAALKVKPGWTELRAASELAGAMVRRGLEPSVVLVGADERLRRFRHPIPKQNGIKKIVMLVICAAGGGLISNITRVVHFGKLPVDLRRRHEACLQVECAMWAATKPGAEAGAVFRAGMDEYARQGFAGEWEKHHQGGPTGYEPRDYLGTPKEKRKVVNNQAFAWNPSITGTKTEDTILATVKGVEVLTPTPLWPMLRVKYGNKTYLRPDILKRK